MVRTVCAALLAVTTLAHAPATFADRGRGALPWLFLLAQARGAAPTRAAVRVPDRRPAPRARPATRAVPAAGPAVASSRVRLAGDEA